MLVGWGLNDFKGRAHLVDIVEDRVLMTVIEELAHLLELQVELSKLSSFISLVLLDSLRGWLDFGEQAH